ncbi:hypothetical protein, partial [Paenibacillus phytohabitans]|uniref:hypothetical protein n=1 Tax=Paenibacillus phytohabitans TaxID=2654978 RepID=UPI001C11002F
MKERVKVMGFRNVYLKSIVILIFLFICYDSKDNLVFAESTKSQELKYFYDQDRIDYIYLKDNTYVDFFYDRNGNMLKQIHREFEGF